MPEFGQPGNLFLYTVQRILSCRTGFKPNMIMMMIMKLMMIMMMMTMAMVMIMI